MKRKRLFLTLKGIVGVSLATFIALGAFLVARPDIAHAVRSFADMARVFARVNIEIMQPTPYGRYYDALYWKHYEELGRIFREYPEYREDMYRLMALYMPNIEATLDGRGDEVQITQAQVNELGAFFEQIRAVASDELRADIDRELVRTPLQDFVGLTMTETLAYIEAAWQRDFGFGEESQQVEIGTPLP